jgi:hypothetical protein
MSVRRMTRLTNGFSKKWSKHEAMMNVFFGVYNFCKVHCTIKDHAGSRGGNYRSRLDSARIDRENEWGALNGTGLA